MATVKKLYQEKSAIQRQEVQKLLKQLEMNRQNTTIQQEENIEGSER